jgi:hypothetical protein
MKVGFKMQAYSLNGCEHKTSRNGALCFAGALLINCNSCLRYFFIECHCLKGLKMLKYTSGISCIKKECPCVVMRRHDFSTVVITSSLDQ